MRENKVLIGILGLCIIATLVLSIYFNFFAADEYTYMNTSQAILNGTFLENGDVARMPLFYVSLATMFLVFGSSELVSKVFVWALLVISIIGVYFLSKELLKNEKKALFATAIFATSPLTIFFATRVLTETLFCLLIVLTALFFIKSEKNQKLLLLTGIFIALLTLTRYVGLYAFFIIGLYWIINKEWNNLKLLSKKIIYLLVGFGTGMIPYLILNYFITGSPIGLILNFFGAQFGVAQGTMSWPDKVPFYFIILPFLIGFSSILFWIFFVKNNSTKKILEKENLLPLTFIFGQWLPLEIFFLKSAALVRYVFGLTPFMAILSAKIINTKKMEKVALILIGLNLLVGLFGTALFYSTYEKHIDYSLTGTWVKENCDSFNSNIDFVLLHYTSQKSIAIEQAQCFVSSVTDGGATNCPNNFIQVFSTPKTFVCKRNL